MATKIGKKRKTYKGRLASGESLSVERSLSVQSSKSSLGESEAVSPTVKKKPRFWTKEEDAFLRKAVCKHGPKLMRKAARLVPNRTYKECVQRWTKVLAPGLKKGKWCPSEDQILVDLVNKQLSASKNGEKEIMWGQISRGMGSRSSKQCRERWLNHLDPSVKKCDWTKAEDSTLEKLSLKYPGKWAQIAREMPGRTENMVKVHWKSLQRRKQNQLNGKSTNSKKPSAKKTMKTSCSIPVLSSAKTVTNLKSKLETSLLSSAEPVMNLTPKVETNLVKEANKSASLDLLSMFPAKSENLLANNTNSMDLLTGLVNQKPLFPVDLLSPPEKQLEGDYPLLAGNQTDFNPKSAEFVNITNYYINMLRQMIAVVP